MAKHSTPTINFFEMMGISEEELSHYLIRLNKSSANWFDVMTLYYEKHDELMNWVFTRRWNSSGRNNGNMPQSKVLQFIQLDGNEIHLRIGCLSVVMRFLARMLRASARSMAGRVSSASSHSKPVQLSPIARAKAPCSWSTTWATRICVIDSWTR